jgi:uncharacterized Zn finger protein
MAGAFGKTWWGEQWLNSLNNTDYSNRLPRGASYARNGAVEKIKNYRQPYFGKSCRFASPSLQC